MKLEHFNKILVVDDSSANLQLLLNLLTEEGYTIYPASDGELALKFVQSTLPDLILLDIKMPGLDGYEVCRRLKADERTASIPVIFLSALEDERDKVKGFQVGGVDYITKPFQPEEMLARIRIHLRIRELTERLEQEVSVRTEELETTNKLLKDEIAERRQAEEALRESENLLNNTQRISKVGGWEFDVKSGKFFWTEELYRIHEIPNDPSIDHLKESLVCYRKKDRKIIFDAFQRAYEQGESYDLEFPFTTFKGKPLFIRTTAQPVYEDGRVVRVVGNIMDITERRQAEEALRITSERLQLATRAANIGIWDWDVLNNELLWEDSMYQLYGIQREDFGGAYDAWIRTLHPEDRAYADGEIQAALHGEREYAPEFRIVRPDGSIRHIKANSVTFKDQQGKPLRMIGTNIDITERKQAEEKLRHYKDDLEETVQQRTEELRLARDAAEAANRAKSVFLANMSHELRTPLNAILGFSQMLQQETKLSPLQREDLDIISNSGMHLLKLINDILEIAKIEAGKLQLEITTFDLHAMTGEVSDMMRVRAQQKGLQLVLDQSSELPRYIKGDESRLRQILINLLSNAIKFTRQGMVTLHLSVKAQKHQHLLIEVADTGPGISEADQQHLFQPFVQLPSGATQGGTGLGLTIIQQFVQLMGGTIAIESNPGEGSLFRIELPLELPDEEEIIRLSNERPGKVTGLEPGQPVYRILIAEDQHENQILLAKLMTDLGLEVKSVDDGEQCVELFKKWQPHLIWMDWRMPKMNGAEAAQQIRQLKGGDAVKIIAVTASAFKEQQDELHTTGMDDYIRKPYQFSEIYDCMARQLGVKFTYQTEAPPLRPSLDALNPTRLATLPATILKELHDSVESLDRERIDEAVEQITALDAELGHTLVHLANKFDYPSILSTLQTMARDKPPQ